MLRIKTLILLCGCFPFLACRHAAADTSQAASTRMISCARHELAFHLTPGAQPAIVLDAGGGEDSSYWDSLVARLAQDTGSMIITYDRAGMGASEEVPGPWSPQAATEDLACGLRKLGATHDVILVSHSVAGQIATYLTRQHPEWFAGAVLVDASVPNVYTEDMIAKTTALYAPVIAAVKAAPPSKPGRQLLALSASFVDTSRAFHKVIWPAQVPAIVIVSEKTPFEDEAAAKWWREAQAQFAGAAGNRRLVVADGSSHDVAHDRPDVILRAVMDMRSSRASAGGRASVGGGQAPYDLLIKGGRIYDGTGAPPYVGDVGIRGDRIAYVGKPRPMSAKRTLEAHGQAVSPGFINMLSQAEESVFADGREESDLFQGVTLEVTGEGDSMGPLTDSMAQRNAARESDIKYPIDWRTLGQYLEGRERAGMSLNMASFVGASTVRDYVLGESDVQPSVPQLRQMSMLVRQAMEEGALGVSSALIYTPATFAKTGELIALATESGRCGGIYATHMRSEGNRFLEAVDETISIARSSGAPAEIYHLKAAGKPNWSKLDPAIAKVEAARASGVRVSADMYAYTAGGTGLDAAMPPWVLEGGLEASIQRLKDPAVRARVAREMNDPNAGYENLYLAAGPDGMILAAFKNDALKPLTGKTLAEVARLRNKSPQETAMDLVIEDGSPVGVIFFVMSEDNVRRETALPWMSFASDEAAPAPEGVFLKSHSHPRAYGNFAKVLAKYVRSEKALTLSDAIHRMTGLPAANLSLTNRGILKEGYFADVVVFDPATIQDHSTYEKPHQLATGVSDVLVNGQLALSDGKATGAHSGRFVRGRAWSGEKGGGCRSSAKDWKWTW
jgi:N-acyl-D-amino-acid deacylase